MKGFRFTTTKNAIANLVRGGATAAVAIALPRFLTRSLDMEHFAAWSLILQIAAYASYLDFGLQTAIARFVAQAAELEQKERQAKLVSTALILLSLAALIAFSIISIVIWQFPHLFAGVPAGLLPEFRRAALLLSLVACLLLPLSTYTGVLIGMHRNEIPALAIGGSRIAGALAVIVACRHTQSLTVLALCIGAPNLLGGLLQMAAVQRIILEGRARLRYISRGIGAELLRFCAGLTVWSFGMLLVSGLDVTIVGHVHFSAVGFYSVASMLITFFAGLTNSALGALLAPVAALHAREEKDRILHILFAATRMTLLANLSLTAAIFLFGGPMLQLWVGPIYAQSALPILKILAIAQTFRLMVAPYSVMLISTGEQSKAIPAAICEALVNLIASVLGIMVLGPIGVAWGTLAGAVCGVLWIILRTMSSVGAFRIVFSEFLANAVLPVSIPCLPLAILWLIRGHFRPLANTIGFAVCVIATAVLGRWCFRHSFRPFGVRRV
jgi:O-antigen/teichoic acid export membrane protein